MEGMATAPAPDFTLDVPLVEALLAAQSPSLAGLPVAWYASGWDNELFRLGDSLLVRIPRRESSAPLMRHEIEHLPLIGSLVTIPVPQPVFVGTPSDLYPHPWAIFPWVPGTPASEVAVADRTAFAEQLADFLWSLHQPAPAHAPFNPLRGGSLAQDGPDARARARIARDVDADALLARWESWTAAPDFDGVDVWVHGDAHPHNFVVGADGLLASVVDWGDVTAGDPACDLATAWLTFDAEGRRLFRERTDLGGPLGEATWTRAKAWALHLGLILAYETDDHPWLTAVGRHALTQLLAEAP